MFLPAFFGRTYVCLDLSNLSNLSLDLIVTAAVIRRTVHTYVDLLEPCCVTNYAAGPIAPI